MTGWLVGHLAILKGLDTLWVVLLVIAAMLVMAVILNLVRKALDRRSQLPEEIRDELPHNQQQADADVEKLNDRITTLEQQKAALETEVCPDKRLHRFGVEDKQDIKNLVRICGVLCRKVAEGREPVHLDFTFAILNKSLFQISVDSIEGYITFYESGNAYKPKLLPRIEGNKTRNLSFRQTGHFVVQQDFLTEAEANYVLNTPDTIFHLNSLKITIIGDEIEPTALNSDIHVKNESQWLDYNEIYFFSSGMLAQNAGTKLTELKAEIVQLEAERNSLKAKIDNLTRHKLIFEIDENRTEVHFSGGSQVRRIEADVYLRFINSDIDPVVIHDLRAALYKRGTLDLEEPILQQVILAFDIGSLKSPVFNGMRIEGSTQTPFYLARFFMEISQETEGRLSPDNFLRIAMKAMRQDDYEIDFYVNSWRDAHSTKSSIRLKRGID